MDSKSLLQRYSIFLAAFLLAGGFLLPVYYDMPYPAPLAPKFEAGVKLEHLVKIEEIQPDLVLVGDSVLYEGVNPVLLSERLGMEVYPITVPGSGTASWYLVMKNVIFEASHRPRYLVVLFRNTMLSVPQYRTTGRYFPLLDDFAERSEPLVSRLAFINQMSPLEKFAAQYLPLYSARLEIREDLDNFLRYRLPFALIQCDRECVDEAILSMFGREVDPSALNEMLEDAARTLYAPEEMDFQGQVGDSFLPYMIELAEKNNVTLIFVRTKIFGREPPALQEYNAALEAYLREHDHVILMDFSADPRIPREFYADSLHMNGYGRQEFTKILAQELSTVLGK
jgi:hypothetical protein